ncbi:lantibiotic dehydratase family protein [Chryseobacterium soli]|uniref:lantibiotic dehydratase family protein n=1 Tax=Chryseobacterium soli TaxID=445961 RepID=UPI002952A413|nr:lantibiotic dehydratase family protein [Chryseobacterium soli]MDV7696963.1 lantibiotic dehydratase family protein [Chryseobacterium soli]
MSKFPYKALDNFVLRTPSKSLNFLKELLNEQYISTEKLKQATSDPFFQEALFLASPNLQNTMVEWIKGNITNEVKQEKLQNSLLKYLSRMSSRCTPFGLFAGYAVGQLDTETNIQLKELSSYKRYTRLDMQYLSSLSQKLIANKSLRNHLIFNPNNTLYKIGQQYRYIEYRYSAGLKRSYHIEAIEADEYFEYIIKTASGGLTVDNLITALIKYDSDIDEKEAKNYINLLIDNQILVSNIDPVVIGKDYLTVVKENILTKKIVKVLTDIDTQLKSIDQQIPNHINRYFEIKSQADKLETEIDLKFLFQADLNAKTKINKIDKKNIKEIKDALVLLNKFSIISKNKSNTYIDNFVKKFKQRYEEQEVPLSKALDPESGIGYKNNDMDEIIPDNTFIDNLVITPNRINKNEINWNNTNAIFHYKITQAYKNDDYIITLNSSDLPSWIKESWNDLPDTLSFMTEFVMIDGEQKIKLDGAGGASGANIFGRFSLNDKDIFQHTEKIIDIEKQINHDSVIVDLAHLPESRIGNVINRPSFSDYEIPYLSQSIKPTDSQILLEDLMISVKSNQIILRSKKLNKRIIPRLINAHNYAANSIPVYHFLCDLQMQGKRTGLSLELGQMEKNYKFIPRIELNNIILKPATWNLRRKDLLIFTNDITSDADLLKAIEQSQREWKLPQYILFAENDNELLINLQNINSIKMMIDAIGEKPNFTFKEFLFKDEKQIVRKGKESFTNQIIITFYNDQKLIDHKNA